MNVLALVHIKSISIKILTLVGAFVLLFSNVIVPVQAADPVPVNPCDETFCLPGFDSNRYRSGNSGEILTNIILDIAFLITVVSVSLAVVFIVYAGFQMLTSLGDSKKFGTARSSMIYAIIGIIVTVVAYGVVGTLVGIIRTTNLN